MTVILFILAVFKIIINCKVLYLYIGKLSPYYKNNTDYMYLHIEICK